MQRKLIQGVPYWVDGANKMYIWQSQEKPQNPIWIGTYNPQTETGILREGWQEMFSSILQSYRDVQASRPRKVSETK